MSSFKNEFSWSNSRFELFETCKRKYFLQYYGSWEGWEQDAPERVRTIYMLKQLDNRHLWKGNTVHDAIAFLLQAKLQDRSISHEGFKKAVVRRMRNQYRQSLAGAYREDPKNNFGLLEHEYSEEVAREKWRTNRNSVLESIHNFLNSEFWKLAGRLELADCLALEGDLNNPENTWTNISSDLSTFINLPYQPSVDNFFLGDLKVWAMLDFAYRKEDGNIRIVDWKSGRSADRPEPMQLNIYGCYATDVWGIPAENIQLTVYNVAQEKRFDRKFSQEQKEEACGEILSSVEEMKSVLVDPAKNIAREEDFPKIENDNICRHCRYRRVCKPELVK